MVSFTQTYSNLNYPEWKEKDVNIIWINKKWRKAITIQQLKSACK